MHVIVVGCGRVGSGLAMSLTAEGHSVSVMDKQPRAFRRLKDWDGPCIVGSGFDRDDLEKAGAVGADALAAVTSGDNTNIMTVRIAGRPISSPMWWRDLRPAASRDLPATRHPDGGHGDVDHRSGAATSLARNGRRRLV